MNRYNPDNLNNSTVIICVALTALNIILIMAVGPRTRYHYPPVPPASLFYFWVLTWLTCTMLCSLVIHRILKRNEPIDSENILVFVFIVIAALTPWVVGHVGNLIR